MNKSETRKKLIRLKEDLIELNKMMTTNPLYKEMMKKDREILKGKIEELENELNQGGMKKRNSNLIHDLMIRYIAVTDEYIKELEDKIDELTEENKFLMARENKLQMLEIKKQYDFVSEDGIGIRFQR